MSVWRDRTRLPALVAPGLLAIAIQAAPVHAAPLLFRIAPEESLVSATGSMGASIGGVGYQASWTSQVGEVPGVAGADLPGFGVSDGLTSAVSGELLVDPDTGTCGAFAHGCMRIDERRSVLQFGPSGQWAPGSGGTVGAPEAAAFAAFANDAVNDVQVELAVRDFAVSLRNDPLFGDIGLVRASATRLVFEFPESLDASVVAGFFDFSTTLPGQPGGRDFLLGQSQGALSMGTLDDLGAGLLRLALTFDVNGSASIPLGVGDIFSASFGLTGQVVAYARQVPEPLGLAAAGLVAAAGLRCARRPHRARVEPRGD